MVVRTLLKRNSKKSEWTIGKGNGQNQREESSFRSASGSSVGDFTVFAQWSYPFYACLVSFWVAHFALNTLSFTNASAGREIEFEDDEDEEEEMDTEKVTHHRAF
jgi:hypothetical protein